MNVENFKQQIETFHKTGLDTTSLQQKLDNMQDKKRSSDCNPDDITRDMIGDMWVEWLESYDIPFLYLHNKNKPTESSIYVPNYPDLYLYQHDLFLLFPDTENGNLNNIINFCTKLEELTILKDFQKTETQHSDTSRCMIAHKLPPNAHGLQWVNPIGKDSGSSMMVARCNVCRKYYFCVSYSRWACKLCGHYDGNITYDDLVIFEGNFEGAHSNWASKPAKISPEASVTTRKIYFIQSGDSSAIKIGSSCNVNSRLKSLQHASPEPLRLLATIKDNKENSLEKQLHSEFAKDRIRGEWFDPSTEILMFIIDSLI